jgi:hypothetical protein
MTLIEALESLSIIDRERLVKVLARFASSSGLCFRARTNLDSESRLPLAAWACLFDGLLDKPDGDVEMIQKAITDALRPWVLNGPPLSAVKPEFFGRAISLDYLCRLLVDAGHFGSVESAKRNVRNVLSKPETITARRWRNYPLGKYLMWSTFSVEADPTDPFQGMPHSAEAIRGILGLDPNERNKPLLLIIYKLPTSVVALFPTIAEAYAGSQWNYFFTPAPTSAICGLTLPWPKYAHFAPRPEVVHEVIQGRQIAAAIKRVS